MAKVPNFPLKKMLKPEVVSMKPVKKSRGFKKLVKNQKYTIKRESDSTLQIGKNTVFLKSCKKTKSPCNTVIWFSKKRQFPVQILVLFSKWMSWLHQFF